MTERTESETDRQRSLASRIGEAAIFCSVVLCASVAVIALALAAPVVLAITTISGVVTRNHAPRRWRPAGA